MTNDMKSTWGVVDSGDTDKAIQKALQFEGAVKKTESSVDGLSDSLLSMDRIAEKSLKSAKGAASGGSGIRGASGALGKAGGTASALGIDGGKEIAQLAQVGQAVSELGDVAKAAKKKTIALIAQRAALATVETTEGVAAGSAAIGTTILTASLGPLAIAAAAVVAVGLVATAVLHEAEKGFDDLADAVNKSIEQDRALIDAKGMSSDAIKEEIAEIERQQKAEQELLGLIEEKNDSLQGAADSMGLLYDAAATVTNFDAPLKATDDALKEQQGTVDDLADRHEVLTEALGSEEVATIDAAEAAEEAEKAAEKTAKALQQLAEQEASLTAKRTQALDDLAIDRDRRDSRAAEDAAEADAKRSDQRAESALKDIANVSKIRKDGTAQQAKTLKAANDTIIKTIQDGNKARDELQKEFSDRAIEDQNRFNERRVQAENDLRNSEFDAIQENDIIGALRAQRAFDEQQKQDITAAARESQQRETEKQERLLQLRDEQSQRIAEVRANLVIEIAEQKLALKQRLADQALAVQERKRQETKADKETEKARQKRQRRQAEDDALADERSERAFKEQLKAIDDKRRAEQQALGAVFGTLQAGGAATVNAVGQATATAITSLGSVTQQFINGLANAANGKGFTPFAEGGIVTRPTLALIGENNKREAVIPLDANGGIPGSGGQPITIYLTTSELATVGDVIQIVQGATAQTERVNVQVLEDSLAGITQ